jgi:hypothetical protein
MQNRIITLLGLACLLGWSTAAMAQRDDGNSVNRPGQYGGNGDHTAAVPSQPPPPGWKACPRCQNQKDRTDANEKYKVAGHPFNPHDISGVWGFNGLGNYGTPPPLTEWGKKQHEATMGEKNSDGEALHTKDTSGRGGGAKINCDPPGNPRLYSYNYGVEFVTLPDRVVEFFELTHTWRTIWTDGRKLPDDPPEPRWLGWNVGRWEGDTFVIESKGFDERSWINASQPDGGWTHSDEMTVVERYRRVDYGTLESQIIITDPKTYTKPWVSPKTMTKLVPGAELWEDQCVPSDYATFNEEVFLPAAHSVDKK